MGCGVGSVGVAIWDAGNGVSVRGPLFTREMAWGLPVASGRAHLARSLREPAVPERTTRTMRVAARAVKAGDQCAQDRSGRASARTHSRSLRRNGVNKLKVLVSTRVVLACCASDAILPKEPCGPVKTLVDLEPDFPASPGGGESRRGSPLEPVQDRPFCWQRVSPREDRTTRCGQRCAARRQLRTHVHVTRFLNGVEQMLTISESAVEVIKLVLVGGDSPEGSGLRIAPAGEGLQASITEQPNEGDEVIEESGVRVFLEPQVAALLGDKVLDAERDANGELALAVRD